MIDFVQQQNNFYGPLNAKTQIFCTQHYLFNYRWFSTPFLAWSDFYKKRWRIGILRIYLILWFRPEFITRRRLLLQSILGMFYNAEQCFYIIFSWPHCLTGSCYLLLNFSKSTNIFDILQAMNKWPFALCLLYNLSPYLPTISLPSLFNFSFGESTTIIMMMMISCDILWDSAFANVSWDLFVSSVLYDMDAYVWYIECFRFYFSQKDLSNKPKCISTCLFVWLLF